MPHNGQAYLVLGNLPVQAIDVALVMKAIEPIWTEKPKVASRVHRVILQKQDGGRAARRPGPRLCALAAAVLPGLSRSTLLPKSGMPRSVVPHGGHRTQ